MPVHSNLMAYEVEYLFTDKQIAKHLGISRATTWRWVKKGDFPKPIKISDMKKQYQQDSTHHFFNNRSIVFNVTVAKNRFELINDVNNKIIVRDMTSTIFYNTVIAGSPNVGSKTIKIIYLGISM